MLFRALPSETLEKHDSSAKAQILSLTSSKAAACSDRCCGGQFGRLVATLRRSSYALEVSYSAFEVGGAGVLLLLDVFKDLRAFVVIIGKLGPVYVVAVVSLKHRPVAIPNLVDFFGGLRILVGARESSPGGVAVSDLDWLAVALSHLKLKDLIVD